MSKHTPGPWKIAKRQAPWDLVVLSESVANTDICNLFLNADDAETAANARLIAAAPAMYDTIKWIASQQDLFFAECSQAEEIVDRCAKVIAAIEGDKAVQP